MKRYLMSALMLTLLSLAMVSAGPTTSVPIVGGGGSPIYTDSNFAPLVFFNDAGADVLYSQMYWQGPQGGGGELVERQGNYLFTGEKIEQKVLVVDLNGVPNKINDVWTGWSASGVYPPAQANCQYIGGVSGDLASQGYSNVILPGHSSPETTGNPSTMGEYLCTLTIEPTCTGQQYFGVTAKDIDGNLGSSQGIDPWTCNPSLDLEVHGSIDFGELSPGQQSSSSFSIENVGSDIEMVLAISGGDFYDPDSSGALCPTSNKLSLQGDQNSFTHGFWYNASDGTHTTGNKRIPYGDGNTLSQSDPLFSSSTQANSWRKWQQNEIVVMEPSDETSVTLHLGLPTPCNGQFTDGRIDLLVWAV